MRRAQTSGGRGLAATLIVILIAFVLTLASCSAASGPVGIPDEGGAPGEEPGNGGRDPDHGLAALVAQRVIKTGEVTIEVEDVARSLADVRAMATRLGGYVGGSQAGAFDEGASLTLRIPAARFDEALAALHELDGEVVAEATREEDVTTQIVDLEARIANLEASEATYRDLVAQATDIEDILAVQTRLDTVRGEIEQLRAQLEAVSGQADLSTMTVTLLPAAFVAQSGEWDPGATFRGALASLLAIAQGIASGLIWLGVVVVPIALVVGVVVVILVRTGIIGRRRTPAPTPMGAQEEGR
jgi:hypothetical protein